MYLQRCFYFTVMSSPSSRSHTHTHTHHGHIQNGFNQASHNTKLACFYLSEIWAYPVLFEGANVFVVGVNELAMAIPFPRVPHSNVLGPSCSVSVGTAPVANMVLPLSLISVTIDIVVLAKTASLVFYPTTCAKKIKISMTVSWQNTTQ